MNTPLHLHAGRGFSLIELIIAMGISTLLMAALASIFATSVSTREKIDQEGQKIETARYSLDTLAEDIRLAGYYGSLAPSLPGIGIVNGATPADWSYVDPCTPPAAGDLPGWSTASEQNTPASNVDVPMAIFGYEAHGTGTLTSDITGCLDNYKTGTDVLVVRRASTTSVTAGGVGWVSGDPYLQTSTCPEGAVDASAKYPPRFIARATTTSTDFSLHMLGCTPTVPGTNSSVRKLIYRIYYVSQCDDCGDALASPPRPSDGIPTLKMIELGVIPTSAAPTTLRMVENVRTIAPGVEDMHLEYGVDTTDDGSIDDWVISNNDPRQASVSSGTAFGTLVTGMRCHNLSTPPADPTTCDTLAENRWEDVIAVNLFLVTRDLKTTSGPASARTFTMGSKSLTTAADGYRRRMTSSTVKLVNMSGRREVP